MTQPITVHVRRRCGCLTQETYLTPPTQAELAARQQEYCGRCRWRERTQPPGQLALDAVAGAPIPEAPCLSRELADLPDLRGTTPQISWAMDVRKEALAAVETHLQQYRRLVENHRDAGREPQEQESRAHYRRALSAAARLEQITGAHWWIERRKLSAAELLAEAGETSEAAP